MKFELKKAKGKGKQKKNDRDRVFSLLNYRNTRSQFEHSEPYRNIRTNIEFSINDKEIKTIAITSTLPSEAKSTTSLNLAIVFANKYENVLLIDCDLRKSRLHKYLKLSNQNGLSNAVKEFSQTGEIGENYIQAVKNKNFVNQLSVITAGKKIANPNEFLSSKTFRKFVDKLRDSYDYIIIDCPPVLSVSDAIPVGNVVDGTIFVYSCMDTQKKDAQSALNLLKQNNVYILGSVLTKAEVHSGRYYNYYYGYGE